MLTIFKIFIFLLFVSCDGLECGMKKKKKSSLVSGGEQSEHGEWPWLVSLHSTQLNETEYFCGSSLVNERVLITAAHCMEATIKLDIFALLGRHNFNDESETNWVKRHITIRIKHEDYKDAIDKQPRSLADIAILLMESPVAYTDFIQPICLPKLNQNVFNVDGIVAGHGRSGQYEPPTEISKFVHMKSISLLKCFTSSTGSSLVLSENSFCAAGPDGIPCFGDSGSGFVSEISGKWTLLGVVSQTLDTNCKPNSLVVFVNLPLYLGWIQTKINEFNKSTPPTFAVTSAPKINPCDFISCGNHKNSHCEVINFKAICKCSNGLKWNSGFCFECLFNFDCPSDMQCVDTECVDLCQNFYCGSQNGARCKVENSKPICECKSGFIWSNGDCQECLEDFDCSKTKICSNFKCMDPCTLKNCGQNSKCLIINGKAQCECLDGFELDNFLQCIKITCKEKNCPLFSRCFESNGFVGCLCLDGMTLDATKTKCQWTCNSGTKNYAMNDRCDGYSDCVDKTDESKCVKGKFHENWRPSGCNICPTCIDCTRFKSLVIDSGTKIDSENFIISSSRDESMERIHMSHSKLVMFLPLTVQDQFPNLIEFDFYGSSVKNIKTENFAGLKQLKILFLTKNEIETIEENSFHDLENLQEFYVHTNRIVSLPPKIFDNLILLKEVELQKNKLEILSEDLFKNLKTLENLRLDENQIVSLPPKIFENLLSLKELYLHKNKLKTLDENLFQNLKSLEKVLLYENQIELLPPKIFENFISLKELYLYKNKLETLSENLFNNLRKLEKFRLDENQIEVLPPKIFENLISLKELYLYKNKLETLDENLFKSLRKLEKLSLYENQIMSLPPKIFENLLALKELYLHKNKMETLDENLFNNLINLETLYLHTNKIESLPPKIFENLNNLKFVEIGLNQIKFLPENLFKNNQKLNQIWIEGNQLHKIDSNIFDDLNFLKFVNLNKSTCMNKEFGNRTNFYVLSSAEKNEIKQELQRNCS